RHTRSKRDWSSDVCSSDLDLIVEDGRAKGVVTEDGESFYAPEIVVGVGREGSGWFAGICKKHGIETRNGTVDVGVRVEVRDEIKIGRASCRETVKIRECAG